MISGRPQIRECRWSSHSQPPLQSSRAERRRRRRELDDYLAHHSLSAVAEVVAATSTGGTSIVFSVPFVAGRLYLAQVASFDGNSTVISGFNSTTYPTGDWLEITGGGGRIVFNTDLSNNMWVLDADTTVTENVTISWAQNQNRICVHVIEVQGYNAADPAGTGGDTEAGSGTSSSISLTFEEAGSGTVGGTALQAGTRTFTADTGWTKGTDITVESISLGIQWRTDTDNFDFSWSDSQNFGSVVSEIRAAGAAATSLPPRRSFMHRSPHLRM